MPQPMAKGWGMLLWDSLCALSLKIGTHFLSGYAESEQGTLHKCQWTVQKVHFPGDLAGVGGICVEIQKRMSAWIS